ncbi:hypothetical protein ACJMK2_011139 [Sinanodonta woodiana]|uniref:FLYWCH-type domain-containing protein n=1 Tax=Sinanodonta woodiana TaxID=1069815 RepID=A0ABD3V3X3_SINWO
MLEFVTSHTGNLKLIVQGYFFTKHSENNDGKILWSCEKRTCTARVHSKDDEIVHEAATHNHMLTPGQVEVERARVGLKHYCCLNSLFIS